ncbi:MAG TPA: hypothetical protein VE153_17575 [Myxococcus sp.]|nr:hypothetical protein [Myxococcus sp.]
MSTGCATAPARGAREYGPGLALTSGGWDAAEPESAPWGPRHRPSGGGYGTPGASGEPSGKAACGGVPPGWPHLDSSEEVLAPFSRCASPASLLALQRAVDMPRLVESLSDWDAVRLGALGPLEARAAGVLHRKRAAFLVSATERYGVPFAEVFALFVLHSACDDEVREVLRLLAEEKHLAETLGRMAHVREELEGRGLGLERQPERAARASDALRGLGRAGRDALATVPVLAEPRYAELGRRRAQLPPAYQQALHEVERALMLERLSPGSVALGAFDGLTFGVPVGFHHLVAGTLRGVGSLAAGEYEQATRELAPGVLLVGLYAAGRGAHAAREASIAGGEGLRLPTLKPRLEALKAAVERLEGRLGGGAVGELARHVQASREGALLVAEWGEAGAVALHQARGNPARAHAWLAEAKAERAGPTLSRGGAARAPGVVAGAAREALEAKLLRAELEAPGARLPADVALLKQRQPALDSPPPGVREGSGLWGEYVEYRAKRLAELEGGQATKGPLRWADYQQMRGLFARGLEFERLMVELLSADAALPRARRQWLGDFEQPRLETHVGVWKPKTGLRYTDVLVIEERPPAGQPPRVETFSFKSRDLRRLDDDLLEAQLMTDASEALSYYGQMLNIRRRTLNPEGSQVQVRVQRVRLVYEGGALGPKKRETWEEAMNGVQKNVPGVEVLLQ